VPKYVTDEQIIEAWKRFGSARKVSGVLKIDIRQIYARRRKIEEKHGIALAVANTARNPSGPSIEKAKLRDAAAAVRAERYERDMSETVRNGTVIVASDCHYWPGLISPAHEAMLRVIKALKPDMVCLNGDILDGARISRHARIMWEKQPTLKEELHAVQDRCAEIERAAGRARLVRTIGNHDARFENYWSSNAPEAEELSGSTLLDYLPRWRAGWALHVNAETDGWTVIRHRPVSGGIHSAYNSTLKSGTHYVHGHLHKLNITPWTDYRGRRYGVDTGTLAAPDGPQFNYTEAGPLNWASGFAVLTFRDGRLLQPELAVFEGGAVYFRGEKV
jgi:hypothetical protein